MGRARHPRPTMRLIVAVLSIACGAAKANEQVSETIDVAQPLLNAIQPISSDSTAQSTGNQGVDAVAAAKETIHERYPDRSIKISREVIQDAHGNYINHGDWKLWDTQGNLVAQGKYHHGQRHGIWSRGHLGENSKLFSSFPYTQFQEPYVSQATFESGELNGSWIIFDVKKNKISEWEFTDGIRHGTSVWFYPNGHKMRTIVYRKGVIDSQTFWKPDGQLVAEETFDEGRKLGIKVTHYKNGKQKQTEGGYLAPRVVQKSEDDWWNAEPATYSTEGKEAKHGSWSYWYPSGQTAQQGRFEYGVPVGKFIWWYSNGQKALEGSYVNGQPTGRWVWWHQNGQKQSDGRYAAGTPTGPWSWWRVDGKLSHRANFSDAAANIATRPRTKQDPGEVKQPAPPTPAIPQASSRR